MMASRHLNLALSLLFISSAAASASDPPEQIRLAVTGAPGELLVAWATSNESSAPYSPVVLWGNAPGSLTASANGSTHAGYVVFGVRSPRLHSAVMTGLAPGAPVFYSVGDGSGAGFSAVLRADGPRAGGAAAVYPLSLAVYGDLGISNSAATVGMLTRMAGASEIAMALHIGDVSSTQSLRPRAWTFIAAARLDCCRAP
jgi:hypothetical protein